MIVATEAPFTLPRVVSFAPADVIFGNWVFLGCSSIAIGCGEVANDAQLLKQAMHRPFTDFDAYLRFGVGTPIQSLCMNTRKLPFGNPATPVLTTPVASYMFQGGREKRSWVAWKACTRGGTLVRSCVPGRGCLVIIRGNIRFQPHTEALERCIRE